MPRARSAARHGLLGGFSWESPRYFVTDPRGYAAVAEEVVRSFAGESLYAEAVNSSDGRHVLFGKHVTEIVYSRHQGSRVHVRTADGSEYRARSCICTFSAGVINAAIASGSIFQPPLPDWKVDAYAKVQNGVYTKVFLQYEKRFWDNADYVLYADPDPKKRGYFAVWQDMESHGKFLPHAANILMVTVCQELGRRLEVQSEARTSKELTQVLRSMYGPSVPEPLSIRVGIWGSDAAFQGSWSNVAVGTVRRDFDAMQRGVGGLFFAGEATDVDFNGFVAGGYHSGDHVAKMVIDDLNEEKDTFFV
eukprot:gnl/TRDRNA2_/TRDRNA2_149472_c0_seq1.p1 gnl/TRDRNA2_/TRDRNA2_149472_c0~~gnl/TRDRNA2_/TRDRNA2_149472_c0_seq1.p1  ORF type:complete len:348 (+),score=53.75 gnl/TRDRNA2_/TRDRNA2_149472_c0_seq1:127-1044(+)